MNKFMGEYVNAAMDYIDLSNNLHNTPELKKACTDRNNARNRDIYTRAKASGNLVSYEEQNELESLQKDLLDKPINDLNNTDSYSGSSSDDT